MPETSAERSRCTRLARELVRQAEQVSRERASDVAPLIMAGLYRDAARLALVALAPGQPLGQAFEHAVAAQLGDEARRAVLQTDAASDAALSPAALEAEVQLRAMTAEALIAAVAPAPSMRLDRVIRWGVIGLTAGLVAVVGFSLVRWAVSKPDLAAGKPWRTSSSAGECHPEQTECIGSRTAILFHTNDEPNPWFEIDLSAPTQFSSVAVRNRGDAARERAVPLILEVSDDQKTWRELARREAVFDDWVARFEPVTARYVRLRVPRTSMLHLERVQILP